MSLGAHSRRAVPPHGEALPLATVNIGSEVACGVLVIVLVMLLKLLDRHFDDVVRPRVVPSWFASARKESAIVCTFAGTLCGGALSFAEGAGHLVVRGILGGAFIGCVLGFSLPYVLFALAYVLQLVVSLLLFATAASVRVVLFCIGVGLVVEVWKVVAEAVSWVVQAFTHVPS